MTKRDFDCQVEMLVSALDYGDITHAEFATAYDALLDEWYATEAN